MCDMIDSMEYTFFITLLREALWRKNESFPNEFSEKECTTLFALTEKQAVLGLIVDSLMRNNVRMPQMKAYEAIGTLEQIKNANRHVNEGVADLHRLMKKYGVNYAIIKG